MSFHLKDLLFFEAKPIAADFVLNLSSSVVLSQRMRYSALDVNMR